MESALSKQDRGRGAASVLEGMAATQKRVLGRLEKWADTNPTKFSKGTGEFLNLAWNNPMQH